MMYSMTGYGQSEQQLPSTVCAVEIRSLNSKISDINLRLPSGYGDMDIPIRKLLIAELQRGKIDCKISVIRDCKETSSEIDAKKVKQYLHQLQNIVSADEAQLLSIAITLPQTIQSITDDTQKPTQEKIMALIQKSIGRLKEFREKEGLALEKEIVSRINQIQNQLLNVISRDEIRIKTIRNRLQESITEIAERVDANRFEQELIYYLEKMDITEEKVRLDNHLHYFLETLHSSQVVGKKLSFIAQEIGREINTIGSKSNDAPLQRIVIEMKNELEKIKEQLLNVL